MKIISIKECNPLCGRCVRHCRQPAGAILVDCPRFLSRPFKIAEHRFVQLDLFPPEKARPKAEEEQK